jgi:hypothetical protein
MVLQSVSMPYVHGYYFSAFYFSIYRIFILLQSYLSAVCTVAILYFSQ